MSKEYYTLNTELEWERAMLGVITTAPYEMLDDYMVDLVDEITSRIRDTIREIMAKRDAEKYGKEIK